MCKSQLNSILSDHITAFDGASIKGQANTCCVDGDIHASVQYVQVPLFMEVLCCSAVLVHD